MDFFILKPIGFLSPALQIFLIAVLFILTVFTQYRHVKKTGKMYENYPVSASPILAPIFEEIIFRGFILSALLSLYSIEVAVIGSSILFGLWHFKNIFWETRKGLSWQMFYAGAILGPVLAILTLWSGTIWLAVILHYINNLWAPISHRIYAKLKA